MNNIVIECIWAVLLMYADFWEGTYTVFNYAFLHYIPLYGRYVWLSVLFGVLKDGLVKMTNNKIFKKALFIIVYILPMIGFIIWRTVEYWELVRYGGSYGVNYIGQANIELILIMFLVLIMIINIGSEYGKRYTTTFQILTMIIILFVAVIFDHWRFTFEAIYVLIFPFVVWIYKILNRMNKSN